MKPRKIVIAGGPGSGKTAIINYLKELGFVCYDEISRQVTLDAREQGIEQLFLTNPLLFSEKLLEGRKNQFDTASNEKEKVVFLDRGLPDVLAYMDYIGDTYPKYFIDTCKKNKYDEVFILPPWKTIFTSDNERYENFEQATKIYNYLLKTYERFDYSLITVPFGTLEFRSRFIVNYLNLN